MRGKISNIAYVKKIYTDCEHKCRMFWTSSDENSSRLLNWEECLHRNFSRDLVFLVFFFTGVKPDNCFGEEVTRAFENTTEDGSPEDSRCRTKIPVVYFISKDRKVNVYLIMYIAFYHNSFNLLCAEAINYCRGNLSTCLSKEIVFAISMLFLTKCLL